MSQGDPSRRQVLAATAGFAAGAATATVLGELAEGDGGTREPAAVRPSASQPSAGTAGAAPGVLGPIAAVPVGGGHVFEAERVVVVQPSSGEFRAYSAVCTHQACVLAVVDAERLRCPCHASVFSTTDGSVVSGPAPRALDRRDVEIDGAELRLV